MNQSGSQTNQTGRKCLNKAVDADKAFYIRKETYEALWAIQVTQDQVDRAVSVINRHNGSLPGRRRRTQNTSEVDPVEAQQVRLPVGGPINTAFDQSSTNCKLRVNEYPGNCKSTIP